LRHQRDERKSEIDDDDTVISPDVSGSSSDGDSNNLAIIPFFVGDKEENVECHPSYIGTCLNPNTGDYNCGSGVILVIGPDVYRLDGDNDGLACES
jgi:hypothetical protein